MTRKHPRMSIKFKIHVAKLLYLCFLIKLVLDSAGNYRCMWLWGLLILLFCFFKSQFLHKCEKIIQGNKTKPRVNFTDKSSDNRIYIPVNHLLQERNLVPNLPVHGPVQCQTIFSQTGLMVCLNNPTL